MAYLKYNVSASDFVLAWESSRDAAEVASRLGMPKPLVHARASYYRRQGVSLKKMPRTGRLDVEALNNLTQQPAEEAGTDPSC